MSQSVKNYIRKVDNSDVDGYNYRDGKEVLKENEQSHCRKLVENTNWLDKTIRPNLQSGAMEKACDFDKARIKGVKTQEAIRLQWEEMSGMDEGTARPAMVTDSKSLQETCQAGNQIKGKRTAIDIAVLGSLVDMSFYSIMWRPGRSQLADPLAKQGACYDRLRQALMSGQADMEF